MGKLKKSSRNTFNYNVNKKKLKIKLKKKDNPHIECAQIRRAWDDQKTTKQNFADMGLFVGQKGILPIKTKKNMEEEEQQPMDSNVPLKPYVIKAMEEEASQKVSQKLTCSRDMIEYVQHMVREHNENYKAMARDEKNYYQDTPKQIKRKVDLYKRCYPKEYDAFVASLQTQKST
ncbi:nucleolar protein 16 [Triplophysa dalaica]|uniref:nucleolar protein 16 n=1 Tax=Triplophysa dalaica TaxID=1582913 RepID=UPI0024DFA000|nr:nucleolar protein 16 [Triplophysa dalaica]